jgi:hypothetical protein
MVLRFSCAANPACVGLAFWKKPQVRQGASLAQVCKLGLGGRERKLSPTLRVLRLRCYASMKEGT